MQTNFSSKENYLAYITDQGDHIEHIFDIFFPPNLNVWDVCDVTLVLLSKSYSHNTSKTDNSMKNEAAEWIHTADRLPLGHCWPLVHSHDDMENWSNTHRPPPDEPWCQKVSSD